MSERDRNPGKQRLTGETTTTDTKAVVVVRVRRVVPVAVRRTAVLSIVVPTAAAKNAIGARDLSAGKYHLTEHCLS